MKPLSRRVLTITVLLVIAVATAAFSYMQAMKYAWVRYGEYDIRSEGTLKPGDLAPDLELARLDGEGSMRLSEGWAVHPLVLVFGSYT